MTSPMDAPIGFQQAVEEFKALVTRLGCQLHYAPTAGDNPPDTVIVTNRDILAEQAVSQQMLETILVISQNKFSWDSGVLTYHVGVLPLQVTGDNVIEALGKILLPPKSQKADG